MKESNCYFLSSLELRDMSLLYPWTFLVFILLSLSEWHHLIAHMVNLQVHTQFLPNDLTLDLSSEKHSIPFHIVVFALCFCTWCYLRMACPSSHFYAFIAQGPAQISLPQWNHPCIPDQSPAKRLLGLSYKTVYLCWLLLASLCE